MTENPRPVIGYIRVGSPDPNTLAGEMQKRRLTDWAAETGHEIVDWVEEFGVGRAGPAFDRAVEHCRGRLIVATAPDRVTRQMAVLKTRAEQVRAAGGQLGWVEGWHEQPPDATWAAKMADILAAFESEERTARAATYARRPSKDSDQAGPQQQAAAAWDVAESLGVEVVAIDGAELGQDPHEIIDGDEL